MTIPLLPPAGDPAENARLMALYMLGLPDPRRSARLQAWAHEAAGALRAPMAAVTFVDRDRVWIDAAHGIPRGEVRRSESFCTHTVARNDLLLVPDARADERFTRNPYVAGATRLRFYAGYPVRGAGGHAVGVLCVLDTVARRLEPGQAERLATLAARVGRDLQASGA